MPTPAAPVRKTLPGEWMAWWARARWEGVREAGLIKRAAAAAATAAAEAAAVPTADADGDADAVELLLAGATTVLL